MIEHKISLEQLRAFYIYNSSGSVDVQATLNYFRHLLEEDLSNFESKKV